MSDSHHELIVIRTFADGIATAIARATLEAHDIPAFALGDDAGGLHPALTFAHGIRLYVRHVDAVRALHVLDQPKPVASYIADEEWASGPPAA